MRILLTGGTGFIGSYVLRALLSDGHEVLALKRPGSRPRVELIQEPKWLERSMEDNWFGVLSETDVLIHLAAVGVSPQKASWDDCFRWNVLASLKLIKQSADAGVSRIVFCGSCVEYGRTAGLFESIPTDAPLAPVGSYAASKAAASMAAIGVCQEQGIELALLRPFTIFGEGQFEENFWPQLRLAAERGTNFKMTAGAQVRDFLPVERCAQAFVLAATRADIIPGVPWLRNVASGNPCELAHFARNEWKRLGARGSLELGATPYRKNEVMRYVPQISDDLFRGAQK
jgi:nucleoside-diphosphate-sugar epimerase